MRWRRRGRVGPSRLPVALVVAAVLFGALALGGCGGDGASQFGDRHTLCSLVARLDRLGGDVERADVKDPGAFDAALEHAVEEYAAVLDDLHGVVPRDLRGDVDQLRAAVEQYRFADGVDAHAALDAYASRTCA